MPSKSPRSWLGLMIGNSRLHWAWFCDGTLRQTWDIPHLDGAAIARLFNSSDPNPSDPDPTQSLPPLPLWIASVVPAQTALWQVNPQAQVMTLEQVPLGNLYLSLGIDRALAGYGAALRLQVPVLVVDAGTALTFTAIDAEGNLIGGAIVAGLQTQARSLAQNTAALPVALFPEETPELPLRWALNTPDAIRSGVIYTVLATVRDYCEAWLEKYPEGAIGLTGGDGGMLGRHLQRLDPVLAQRIRVDPHLIFWGMQRVVEGRG